MSTFSRQPDEVTQRYLRLLAELETPGSPMVKARTAVLELVTQTPLTNPELQPFAHRSVQILHQVAADQGFATLLEVPPNQLFHAVSLWCALQTSDVEQTDPEVAEHLRVRIEEHLQPMDDADDEGPDNAAEPPEEPFRDPNDGEEQFAIGVVVRPHRRPPAKAAPNDRLAHELTEVLDEVGATATTDSATGQTVVCWRGHEFVRIDPRRRPHALWVDPELGQFLTRVMEYSGLVAGLQQNRGLGTAGLRQLLRENLSLEVLIAEARSAGVSVESEGGLATKKHYFTHPLLGQFLQVTVPRGQRHVIDMAFDSPNTVRPVGYFVSLVYRMNHDGPG